MKDSQANPTRNCTLLFLIKRKDNQITHLCLAMKKRGFGEGLWNGAGGKVDPEVDRSIEEAAIREAREEFGVEARNLLKVAENGFFFPHKPEYNQTVHVFITDQWEGEPTESEEMKPEWFTVEDIPYGSMWSDDILWLPEVLEGRNLRGRFVFTTDQQVKEHEVTIIEGLSNP